MTKREREALLRYAQLMREGKFPVGVAWELIHGLTEYPYHPCMVGDPIRGSGTGDRVVACAEIAESMAREWT